MSTKLSSIQSERVLSILEETLDKLKFLGALTPDVLSHREELSQYVGDEISRIIEEQRRLERKYEKLLAKRGELKSLANKSLYKQNQRDIQETSRQLRESTKNLCRNLEDNPNVGGNLIKIQRDRNELTESIRYLCREIAEKNTFERLVSQVNADEEVRRERNTLVSREKETTAQVLSLEKEVVTQKKEHENELRQRKAAISTLKEELRDMKTNTVAKMTFSREAAFATVETSKREYAETEKDLRRQIEILKKSIEVEKIVFEEIKSELQNKSKSLVEASASWSDRFTEDMESYEKELQRVQDEKEIIAVELSTLRERRENEKLEEAAKEAERKHRLEMRKLKREEDRRRERAAIRIQNGWRTTIALAQEKNKGGGGKKKKGKKGKKKGGKKKKGKKKK